MIVERENEYKKKGKKSECECEYKSYWNMSIRIRRNLLILHIIFLKK